MITNVKVGNAGSHAGAIIMLANERRKHGGQHPDRTAISYNLADLVEPFLEARQRVSDPKPIKPKTVRIYRQGLTAFCSALASAKWEEEIASLVSTVAEERLASGKIKGAGINPYLRAVNAFLSWCKEVAFLRNHIKVNLLAVKRRKKAPTLGTGDIEWWKQFKSVTLSQHRVKYMALLVLDTGVRAEECLALQESDIEWSGSRLWIGNGKGDANREVPLSTDGKMYLRQFLAFTSEDRKKAGASHIFFTKAGGQLSYRNSLRDLKKLAAHAGTSWVGWHSFRRTFATQYIRSGGLLTDLQQILGHSDIRTTILYLCDGIEQIVALHDEYSPLSPTGKRRRNRASGAQFQLAKTALTGGSRKW